MLHFSINDVKVLRRSLHLLRCWSHLSEDKEAGHWHGSGHQQGVLVLAARPHQGMIDGAACFTVGCERWIAGGGQVHLGEDHSQRVPEAVIS